MLNEAKGEMDRYFRVKTMEEKELSDGKSSSSSESSKSSDSE